jgi:hypothetical protein
MNPLSGPFPNPFVIREIVSSQGLERQDNGHHEFGFLRYKNGFTTRTEP